VTGDDTALELTRDAKARGETRNGRREGLSTRGIDELRRIDEVSSEAVVTRRELLRAGGASDPRLEGPELFGFEVMLPCLQQIMDPGRLR